MRVKTLEIVWHDQQPVYSIDIQPSKSTGPEDEIKSGSHSASTSKIGHSPQNGWRLASAGADGQVRLWHIQGNLGLETARGSSSSGSHGALEPRVEYLATLQKHNQAVNVVRFSPSGDCLASAGDDGNVLFWVPSETRTSILGTSSEDLKFEKEIWRVRQSTRNLAEIYDIAWSPCGQYILTGSTDNCARIFDVRDGGLLHQIADHSHYIQGVAWDPLGEYIATQSSDRSVHVYSITIRDSHITTQQIGKNSKIEAPRFARSLTPSPSPSRHVRERSNERGQYVNQQGSIMAPEPITPYASMGQANAQPFMGPSPTPSASLPGTPASSSMNLPMPRSLSRRSSYSASNAASPPRDMRSPSPAPSMHPPLQAIRPASPKAPSTKTSWRMYHDESLVSFFRRLAFSPEGSLLLTPAGRHKPADGRADKEVADSLDERKAPGYTTSNSTNDLRNTVYIYTRTGLSKSPVAHLPGHRLPSVATRVSPVLYKLRKKVGTRTEGEPEHVILEKGRMKDAPLALDEEEDKEAEPMHPPHSVFALPYRMIFAIATQDAVLIYDTQQKTPLAMFTNFHYATFTDLSWSPDGATLVLSSSDGYCTIVAFEAEELGSIHSSQPHNGANSIPALLLASLDSPHLPIGSGTGIPSHLSLRAPTPPMTPATAAQLGESTFSIDRDFVQCVSTETSTAPIHSGVLPAAAPVQSHSAGTQATGTTAVDAAAPESLADVSSTEPEPSKKKRRVALTLERK